MYLKKCKGIYCAPWARFRALDVLAKCDFDPRLPGFCLVGIRIKSFKLPLMKDTVGVSGRQTGRHAGRQAGR